MFSYADIIYKAYLITKRYPMFWLFGMFVVGAFNLNFFFLPKSPRQLGERINAPHFVQYLIQHPAVLVGICLSVLWLALITIFLTNWSKILILLKAQSVLEKKHNSLIQLIKQSKSFLWPMIKVSVLTSLCMLGALVVLAAPLWVDVDTAPLQNMLLVLSVVIFFPLAFTISCLNIFTGMFVVLSGLPLKRAINAATDFFAECWQQILALSLLLAIIYLASFVVGAGLVSLVRTSLRILVIELNNYGFLHILGIFTIIKALGGLLLWVLLGMLNAFLNIALMLFFLQKITPTRAENKTVSLETAPAPAVG